MSTTQEQRFERRVDDLRVFRLAERVTVEAMERSVDDPIAFDAAAQAHEVVLDAVRMAAEELAVVYYEN
jgi:hypothetical protein